MYLFEKKRKKKKLHVHLQLKVQVGIHISGLIRTLICIDSLFITIENNMRNTGNMVYIYVP